MKVGLISKLPHCKPHVGAIKELGFEVKKLGPSPTGIPKSVDILVVRVDSVSHGGDAVARKWARSTNKPVVYENGVSGIRRELSAMTIKNNLRTPPKAAPWANAFSDDQFLEAYREVKAQFVPSPGATELTHKCDADSFEWKDFTYKVEGNFEWYGKPVHSLIYFYLHFHQKFVPYKRDVNKVYKALTGKNLHGHTMCLVAWNLHFDPPVNAPRGGNRGGNTTTRGGKSAVPAPPPVPVEPSAEKVVEIRDLSDHPTGIPDPCVGDTVESNTQAILEVMEDLSTFKKEVHLLRDQKMKLVGDQMIARTRESRLKALNDTPDTLSSNPFAALEQVKAALKAAGFKGTLTLTIE